MCEKSQSCVLEGGMSVGVVACSLPGPLPDPNPVIEGKALILRSLQSARGQRHKMH